MKLEEMKNLWHVNDEVNEKLSINFHCLDEIQSHEVRSNLSPLLRRRIWEAAFHGAFMVLLLFFLVDNINSALYLIPAGLLFAFYTMLLVNSIRQIQIVWHIDYSKDIMSVQKSLTTLQVHSINFLRLLFLFLPAILAWPMIVSKLIQDRDITWLSFMDFSKSFKGDWWKVQLVATCVWLPACFWLYLKVSVKNIHIPWVKNIIKNAAGRKVAKAAEYLEELNSLK